MEQAQAPLARLIGQLSRRGVEADPDEILNQFLTYLGELKFTPYPAQEEAVLELLAGKHVILNTPTGSGKSLVALALHFLSRIKEKYSYYTAPTKALVNEKFFALCEAFGPESVGLLTGDASVNRSAPIICCTAEILSNMALHHDDLDVAHVVMDEFHYYGDKDRGAAWQIPLITMKKTTFLLMSATLSDMTEVAKRLEAFTGRQVAVVCGRQRPGPLEFEYRDTPLHDTIENLIQKGEAPIYLVNFTQRGCAEEAQNLTSLNVCSTEDKRVISEALQQETFNTPYGKEFPRFLRAGLGVHHAGLLPKYRRIVERLAQTGLIKVISGTDTLGVGVNIPIRTVVFTQLYKYDGQKTAILRARDFHQIAGRAGRKGFDDSGRVVVQAPEWVIENRRIEAKLVTSPHLKNKVVRKRPPPRAISWDKAAFQRLLLAQPEPLKPQFDVSHGMLVNLLSGDNTRSGGGYRRLVELIQRSHLSEHEKRGQRKRAAQLFRSLLMSGVVEVWPGKRGQGAEVVVRDGLQRDFSLNHTLSLYLIETLGRLDPSLETYALDMLTLVESILENPDVILYHQVSRVKDELVGQMKADGVEYEDRMARLEQVEHPKPNAEFIYETFNAFSQGHPWIRGENIRPKSIAREMFERCMGFNEYINEYGLARSEGVLLRYLSQTYRTAVQSVPEPSWTEEFENILSFLYDLVRRTDSSLIEEWELLLAGPRAQSDIESTAVSAPPRPRDLAADPRAFIARVRTELHLLLKALSARDFATALTLLHQTEENDWTAQRLAEALAPYFALHASIDITPRARQTRNTIFLEESSRVWAARQKIVDPQGEADWIIDCVVDLTGPRDPDRPLIELRGISG